MKTTHIIYYVKAVETIPAIAASCSPSMPSDEFVFISSLLFEIKLLLPTNERALEPDKACLGLGERLFLLCLADDVEFIPKLWLFGSKLTFEASDANDESDSED